MARSRPLTVLFALGLLGAGAAAPITLPALSGGAPGAGDPITLTATAQLYVGDAEKLDWLGSARTLPAGPILVDSAQTFGKLRTVVARVAAGGAARVELGGGQGAAPQTLAFDIVIGEQTVAPGTLRVRVTADAVYLVREGDTSWMELKRKEGQRDTEALDALLAADRSINTTGTAAQLLVDDEVSWADAAGILEHLRKVGYSRVDISWRPAQLPPRNAGAEAMSTGMIYTRTVTLSPDGGFSWVGPDGAGAVAASNVRAWEQQCNKKDVCMLAAVDADGKRYLAGTVSLPADDMRRRFMFSRAVRPPVTELPTGKPAKRTGEITLVAKSAAAPAGTGFSFGVAPQAWVNIPAAGDAKPVVEGHAAYVRTAEGKQYFEGKEIAADGLDAAFAAWRATLSRGLLVLHLDASESAATMLDVVGRARKAGFNRIALAIRPKADGQLRGLVFEPALTDAGGAQVMHLGINHGGLTLTRARTLLASTPVSDPPDAAFLHALLAADLKLHGKGRGQLEVGADASLLGVVRALGAIHGSDYDTVALTTGEPVAVGGLAAPTKAPEVPSKLEVNAQGRFVITPAKGAAVTVELADQAGYYESCSASTCTMILRHKDGRMWMIGERAKNEDALRAIVFGRPVSAWSGPKLPAGKPVRAGDLAPLPKL